MVLDMEATGENEMTKDFRPGERVTLTEYGIKQGMRGRAISNDGIVLSVSQNGLSVKVRKEGLLHAREYWHGLWRRPRKRKK